MREQAGTDPVFQGLEQNFDGWSRLPLVKGGNLWYIGYTMKKEGDMMGTMTSRQRQSYVRFLLMALKGVRNEPDPEKMKNKLDEIIDNLQKTLED